MEAWFDRPVRLAVKGDMIVAMTPVVAAEMEALDYLHPLLRGTAVGQLKGKDIVPDADLALSIMLKRGAFPEVELSKDKALAFLHKDAITLPEADRGIVLLTYGGHPLGFVKIWETGVTVCIRRIVESEWILTMHRFFVF